MKKTTLKGIKAFVFDFDMTLIDTLEAAKKTQEEMKKLGYSFGKLTDKEMFGMKFDEIMKEVAKNYGNKKSWEEIAKIDRDIYIKNCANSKLIGIKLLKLLMEKQKKLGIVSSNTTEVIKSVLQNKFNNKIKFDVILSNTEGKTKKHLIEECMKEFNTKSEETVYIGDHVNDIKVAKETGVISIAVVSGLHTKEELKEYNPDILVDNLDKLIPVLR